MKDIVSFQVNKYKREIFVKTLDGWEHKYQYKTDQEGFEIYQKLKENFRRRINHV